MSTTKLGGEFLETFKLWRSAKILKKDFTVMTISPDSLQVPDFLLLTTFNSTTKKDFVKERADKYLIDIINYFQSDQGLLVLGIPRPVLGAELLEYVQDVKVIEFFKEYSKLWLLQSIYHTEEAEDYKCDIRAGLVEEEINDITTTSFLARQCMMLYTIALIELVPKILPYIFHSQSFNPKVRAFLLADNKIQEYVQTTILLNMQNVTSTLQNGFNELKAKLDILQPNYALSNDILGTYTYSTLAFLAVGNLSPVVPKPIILNAILKYLKQIQKNLKHEYNKLVISLKTSLVTDGNIKTVAEKLAQLFYLFTTDQTKRKTLKDISIFSFVSQDTALPITAGSLDPSFALFKDNPVFIKFTNGLFASCHFSVLSYGLLNYESLEKGFNVNLLYSGASLFIKQYIDAATSKRVYTRMGEFLLDLSRHKLLRDPLVLSNALKTLIPMMFNIASRELAYKLIPTLFILAKDRDCFTRITSQKVQKWGAFSLKHSLGDINQNIVGDVCNILQNSSYGGTSVLNYGGIIFGLYLRKYIKDSIIKSIPAPGMYDSPDPIYDFIHATNKRFVIDYDNEEDDDDEEDYESNWKTYYESATLPVQSALDILSK